LTLKVNSIFLKNMTRLLKTFSIARENQFSNIDNTFYGIYFMNSVLFEKYRKQNEKKFKKFKSNDELN
jgi:hypothetical protein